MEKEYKEKLRKSNHINLQERIKIEVSLATGKSIKSIAKELGRAII